MTRPTEQQLYTENIIKLYIFRQQPTKYGLRCIFSNARKLLLPVYL